MIETALANALKRKAEKNFEYLYICIDIHDTIVKSNYIAGNIPKEFYLMR